MNEGIVYYEKLHEDTVFMTRVNFFLVAESMLFVSYANLDVGEWKTKIQS